MKGAAAPAGLAPLRGAAAILAAALLGGLGGPSWLALRYQRHTKDCSSYGALPLGGL